ncbi:MAG TPA: T9SS type A sorting domain-containing protein [Chitinophagales bacterium]|nr:T9SS type A sorting domain-containing protein [Chitinophagales bacterium]
MKAATLLFPLFFLLTDQNYCAAQPVCNDTSVGFIPINDLGVNDWNGYQGGLYPSGSNYRPAAHNTDGLNFAAQVVPLDSTGNSNSNGRIVWLSVGMSNTKDETMPFLNIVDTAQSVNQQITFVNGAQGGQTAKIISDSNALFWSNIDDSLHIKGVTAKQVEVIWFKEADGVPTDSVFPHYADTLRKEFKIIMHIIKQKYPNVKLCYHSSRIYGGYASNTLNPEPYAYHSGWAVKWLIEDQINGDAALTYDQSPWLAWGPYLWADGIIPRSDGLVWICPDDFKNDGTHPSTIGAMKVAQMLFDFFSSDSTATPWFLPFATGMHDAQMNHAFISINPNPTDDEVLINISLPQFEDAEVLVTDLTGKILYHQLLQNILSYGLTIDLKDRPAGMYLLQVKVKEEVITKKILVVR